MTEEKIAKAYDRQAGKGKKVDLYYKARFAKAIADSIHRLCHYPMAILEAGTGEAQTLLFVACTLGLDCFYSGFDISPRRIAIAAHNFPTAFFWVGSLLNIPRNDSTSDVVFTSHAMEPNGGREKEIVSELFRVSKYGVVLAEPDFATAPPEGKRRMKELGYVKDIPCAARSLGLDVVSHASFPEPSNPLNPTSITVIRKAR